MFTLTLHLKHILSPIVLRYRTKEAAQIEFTKTDKLFNEERIADDFGSSVRFDRNDLAAVVIADMARDAEGQIAVMAVQQRAAQTAQVASGQSILTPGTANGRVWGN